MNASQRAIPALPGNDPVHGEIRWDRWEPGTASLCPSLPSGCDTCGDAGPGSTALGKTRQTVRGRRITVRSAVLEGRRPQSEPVPPEAAWLITHYTTRCTGCDEMFVYRLGSADPSGEFTELTAFYNPPATIRRKARGKAKEAPQEEALF